MRIDGRLDEEVYRQVPAITEFIQQEPQEGAPVSESTSAWVLYDDDNIYVSCRCLMADRSKIVANDMRRDSTNLRQNDNFGVFLDTFHDLRNGYLFYVSPIGGMFDGATSNERINNADWNTIWDARVSHSDEGWDAEIVIPFKSLRYQPGSSQIWGINLRRTIRGRNEYAYVAPLKPEWGVGAFFRASSAATLVGLEVPTSSLNLEIKPYAASRLTTDRLVTPAVQNDWGQDVGVDVKYGLTKSLTADFTYNTDFAQVEVDEAQVNLTRFNLQFPEKRDFFLEGQGIFTFGGMSGGGGGDAPTIFYSRRIGLQGSTAIPINAGARLSGRVGRYSIGGLNIGTDDIGVAPRSGHQLHRRPGAPRRAAAEHRGRAVHEPLRLDRGGWKQPGLRPRRQLRAVAEHWYRRLRGPVLDRRPVGRRAQLPRELQLHGRPLRPAARPDRRRRCFQPGGGLSPAEPLQKQLRVGAVQPAARAERHDPSVLLRGIARLHDRQPEPARVADLGRLRANGPAEQRQLPGPVLSGIRAARAGLRARYGHHHPAGHLFVSARARLVDARATASPVWNPRRRRGRILRRHQEDRVGERAVRRDRSVRARTQYLAELAVAPGLRGAPAGGRRPRDLHHDAPHVRRRARPGTRRAARRSRPTSASGGSTNPAASCSWCTPTRTTRPRCLAWSPCRIAASSSR